MPTGGAEPARRLLPDGSESMHHGGSFGAYMVRLRLGAGSCCSKFGLPPSTSRNCSCAQPPPHIPRPSHRRSGPQDQQARRAVCRAAGGAAAHRPLWRRRHLRGRLHHPIAPGAQAPHGPARRLIPQLLQPLRGCVGCWVLWTCRMAGGQQDGGQEGGDTQNWRCHWFPQPRPRLRPSHPASPPPSPSQSPTSSAPTCPTAR